MCPNTEANAYNNVAWDDKACGLQYSKIKVFGPERSKTI